MKILGVDSFQSHSNLVNLTRLNLQGEDFYNNFLNQDTYYQILKILIHFLLVNSLPRVNHN